MISDYRRIGNPPQKVKNQLTLKRPGARGEGEGGGGVQFDPLVVFDFSKSMSSKERVKPWFFVTLIIIISHIFPENFIEITQVVPKI